VKVKEATKAYEDFLRKNLPVIEADLERKHEQMSAALFPFLRSTFYRWSELFRQTCPDLATAPLVLAVGDLHVENFGTWRDSEGRLIWGINDFDEAQTMPYTIDLLRLATSALLSAQEAKLAFAFEDVCTAIVSGYGEWLEKGGRPFVLEEEHGWLRVLATGALRDPVAFAAKMDKLKETKPPQPVVDLLTEHLPKGSKIRRFAARVAGLGSLGRPRYVALADLDGGLVVREAKATLPSAWTWSLGQPEAPLHCKTIVTQAVRCADPWLDFEKGWAIRRLAPHCSRVEMTELPHRTDDLKLVKAMGRETANIHLGSKDAIKAVSKDLAKRPAKWLFDAATAMAEATKNDWLAWRS
jgi:hypothetical protein